jgi:TatD DNase family protein
MFVDSHCHIDFYDTNRTDEIVKNANDAGVSYMLNACASCSSFQKIIDITNKYDCVFGAIGQHPEEAEREGIVSTDELLNFINKSKKIIAIGETGLDYSGPNPNKDLQIQNLLNHISVARQTNLPLIIHNRDSNDDMTNILTSEMKKEKFKAIIHCFTADLKMANAMLDLGFYISASGIITFKKADELREVFSSIPNNRILIETDSPYLAPTPYRGHENQPAFVKEVAKQLAILKDIDTEEIGNITTSNFEKLFNLKLKQD